MLMSPTLKFRDMGAIALKSLTGAGLRRTRVTLYTIQVCSGVLLNFRYVPFKKALTSRVMYRCNPKRIKDTMADGGLANGKVIKSGL